MMKINLILVMFVMKKFFTYGIMDNGYFSGYISIIYVCIITFCNDDF